MAQRGDEQGESDHPLLAVDKREYLVAIVRSSADQDGAYEMRSPGVGFGDLSNVGKEALASRNSPPVVTLVDGNGEHCVRRSEPSHGVPSPSIDIRV
jgi:hypothetical protein